MFHACIRKAIKAGVKTVIGTDYVGWEPSLTANEFRCLVDLGMTPMEAIKAGTSLCGELLGWDVGQIAIGKLADIIAVYNDPLQDILQSSKE